MNIFFSSCDFPSCRLAVRTLLVPFLAGLLVFLTVFGMNILGLTDPVVQPTGALELADENSLNTTEFTNNVSELLIGLLLALVTGTLVSTGFADHQTAIRYLEYSASTLYFAFSLSITLVASIYMQERRTE